MKVVYVTSSAPFGPAESFLFPELSALEGAGVELLIAPVRPTRTTVHAEGRALLRSTRATGVVSLSVVRASLLEILRSPRRVAAALLAVLSGGRKYLLKNLAVFPKGLWLARLARQEGSGHLHAYWASTPATVALIASLVSGIPFSMTGHAWDIVAANMLDDKVRRATWCRAIAGGGQARIRSLIDPQLGDRVRVVRVGVNIPPTPAVPGARDRIVCMTPATLEARKGQHHLLAAIRQVRVEHPELQLSLVLAGQGPMRRTLESQAATLGISDAVEFAGVVPHERLMDLYAAGMVDMVVLSSVARTPIDEEGVPVSLMEAMAHGIPVIATDSGWTAELVGRGAGLLVPQGNRSALAAALYLLASNPSERDRLGRAGRSRVMAEFDATSLARQLKAGFAAGGPS